MAKVLALWHRVRRWPYGGRLFGRIVSMQAPYFATIAPTVVEKLPASQSVHVALPLVVLYFPATQAVHGQVVQPGAASTPGSAYNDGVDRKKNGSS